MLPDRISFGFRRVITRASVPLPSMKSAVAALSADDLEKAAWRLRLFIQWNNLLFHPQGRLFPGLVVGNSAVKDHGLEIIEHVNTEK